VSAPLAVLFAIVLAIAEVLPLAGRAHANVLGLALDVAMEAPFRIVAHLAAAIALTVLARRRINAFLGDGLGALVRAKQATETKGAREAFGLGAATAIGVPGALILGHFAEGMANAPIAIGIGFVGTGAMLMSTSAATRTNDEGLTARRAVIVGLAQAFAALAGGSAMGAGIAALVWTGMRGRRAAETAALLTVPHEIAFAALALAEPSAAHRMAERPGVVLAAFAAALIAAILAGGRLVRVAERRLVALGAYLAVLGAGTTAYGWAIH
jgi:undecaprenyl pyrophosphate phosphatase UppP